MFRVLRIIQSPLSSSSKLQSPQIPISPAKISTHNPRRKIKKSKSPPPPDESEISGAISSLPPRFNSSDLSSAISRLSDPRICIPLLQFALHRPNIFRRREIDSSLSPFHAAIKTLGVARLYREMDSVVSLAFSFSPFLLPLTEDFFNDIIHFYAEARWISKAIGVYKFMCCSSRSAVRPSNRTYNLLFVAILGHRGANSYVHYLYMDALRSLFRQMVESGVSPDVHALNAMIKGYVLSLHVNDALRIFHQMVPIYGVEPNEHTYSYLLHGLCSQGRTENAKELYREMRGKGLVPTGRACNSIVSVLAMAGEVEEAVATMWEGVGMRRRPDFITCRTLVEEICRGGEREDDAVLLLREMRQKEVIDGRCYRELLYGLREESRRINGI